MLYYAVNVTTTEAELFTIRYGINQAVQIPGVAHIIVIMDAIYVMHHIFNLSIHPYQLQSIVILKELRKFFNKDPLNSIIFWDCPSDNKQPLYFVVNKEFKEFSLTLLFPCKSSWDFERKDKCNNILKQWKIIFQALDDKR